ncbi:ornithine cyclodeaminase family protein [soil metagenome]
MLIIDHRAVEQVFTMPIAIDVMRDALLSLERGDALQPMRTAMTLPGDRDMFWIMPAVAGTPASLGLKALTAYPGNHGTAFDTHQGAVLLFGEYGELLALVDATALTATRTAAVSAVATAALARPDATDLAILGSGSQAMAHVQAMTCVRPISRVRVWSRTSAHAERFAHSVRERFGVAVSAHDSVQAAVDGAGIICTTTGAQHPILERRWVQAGTHINAVGSGSRAARELEGDILRSARVFVDRTDSALREAGDIVLAIAEGLFAAGDIAGDVGAVLAGRIVGRARPEEITLFKSVGLAIEDVAAARATYDACRRLGLGLAVPFGTAVG